MGSKTPFGQSLAQFFRFLNLQKGINYPERRAHHNVNGAIGWWCSWLVCMPLLCGRLVGWWLQAARQASKPSKQADKQEQQPAPSSSQKQPRAAWGSQQQSAAARCSQEQQVTRVGQPKCTYLTKKSEDSRAQNEVGKFQRGGSRAACRPPVGSLNVRI